MIALTWIEPALAVFTGLGWAAAGLLWLKNADLEDEKADYIDRLREAHLENARLRYQHSRERMEAIAAAVTNVVPIREAKP